MENLEHFITNLKIKSTLNIVYPIVHKWKHDSRFLDFFGSLRVKESILLKVEKSANC